MPVGYSWKVHDVSYVVRYLGVNEVLYLVIFFESFYEVLECSIAYVYFVRVQDLGDLGPFF